MQLNSYIEHTVLKQQTTADEVLQLCNEALQHQFAGVCVPPYFVSIAANKLQDEPVAVVTVVGFPLGYDEPAVKVEAARSAIEHGADEIDMVVNVAAIKSGNWDFVVTDITEVVQAVHEAGAELKVIVESGILTKDELVKVCNICAAAKVDYVKTSTGFAEVGARVEDVKIMRQVLPDYIRIKASGGIKDKAFAKALIEAGADRLGTSSGVKLVMA